MKKQALPAFVEIQTNSSMLEIHMQGVYSLLQLAIVFTCQLLPNKVVTRPDVWHPRSPADVRLFGRPPGGRQGRPVTVGSRDLRTASPIAPPIVGRSGRPLAAVRFLCPAAAVRLGHLVRAARLA
jgi:hypothetical protein